MASGPNDGLSARLCRLWWTTWSTSSSASTRDAAHVLPRRPVRRGRARAAARAPHRARRCGARRCRGRCGRRVVLVRRRSRSRGARCSPVRAASACASASANISSTQARIGLRRGDGRFAGSERLAESGDSSITDSASAGGSSSSSSDQSSAAMVSVCAGSSSCAAGRLGLRAPVVALRRAPRPRSCPSPCRARLRRAR